MAFSQMLYKLCDCPTKGNIMLIMRANVEIMSLFVHVYLLSVLLNVGDQFTFESNYGWWLMI